MRRAFLEGWGAVIAKTVSLDASKVFNVSPRYSKIKSRITGELIGWENIELISDRPFETMVRGRGRRGSCFGTLRFSSTFPFFDLSFLPHISLSLSLSFLAPRPSFEQQLDDFKRLKDEFPDRVLIASIMEEYSEERWLELVERVEVEGGVDAIEINFSCPHGMPGERLKVSFFRGA
jgi:dihydropyrimidine dehydrogenase (NADP+)